MLHTTHIHHLLNEVPSTTRLARGPDSTAMLCKVRQRGHRRGHVVSAALLKRPDLMCAVCTSHHSFDSDGNASEDERERCA